MEFGGSNSANSSFNKSNGGTPKAGGKTGRGFRAQQNMRKLGQEGAETAYPSALQLYSTPPTMDISLEQFEDWAVERLRLLRIVEKVNMSGKAKFSEDWRDGVWAEVEKQGLKGYLQLAERQQASKDNTRLRPEEFLQNRKVDHVSHFILRLAYCRTEELRRWFVGHETDLFRLRWAALKDSGISQYQEEHLVQFMECNQLSYQPIDKELQDELGDDLFQASGVTKEQSFYSVPWLEAVELVKSRRVLVRGGAAFIPESELLSLVTGVFRSRLNRNLAQTMRALPVLEEDQRLVDMVQNLDKRYTGEDYGAKQSGEKVLPAQIDPLSKQNFPLCMKSMQEVLNTSHHIKYKARLQYGLFLKGIGLSLEDALKFFRGEFTKRTDVDVDKFEKEYSYGIRYNYGKEGKKKNWQPYDCMRIIMETVGPGENHGCPFRHHEARTVRQRVEAYGLKKEQVDPIMAKIEEGHYQIACGLHYSAVHLKELSTGAVTHPNQWYMESRGLVVAGKEGGGGSAKTNTHIATTHVAVYSSQASQAAPEFPDMDDSELLEVMDTGTPLPPTQDLLDQYRQADKENTE